MNASNQWIVWDFKAADIDPLIIRSARIVFQKTVVSVGSGFRTIGRETIDNFG
jgi:hypothetical protein